MKAKITYASVQARVAAASGIPKSEAQSLLKELTAAVVTGLVVDGKVNLSGLGRFSRKVQSARRGRNPRTGEPIDIPEKNRVHFLPEAKWRRHVNREYEQVPAVPAPPPPEPVVKAAAGPVSLPATATAATPQPGRKAVAVHPVSPDKPARPDKTEAARTDSQPAPPVAVSGKIPPEKKAGRKHRARLAPAVGLMLLLAAAIFFLGPRTRPPVPTEPSRPEPTRAAVGVTFRPQPEKRAALEIAAPRATPTVVPAAEAASPEPVPAKPAAVSAYTVTAGDSLWEIANRVYNYPYFWPVIFQANQAGLKHPDTLTVGLHLAIPAFTGRVGQLVESDFQRLADGYLRVYKVYRRSSHPRAPYYLWVAYRLRAHWVPENELMMGKPADREFISRIRGRGLIY